MPNATINNMKVGQTQRVHVKAYAQDDVNNPSQIADTTTPLVVASTFPAFASAAIDPNDNRAIIITATAPGNAVVSVDENPLLQTANRLLLFFTVIAPPPDTRRVDFLSADQPTP